MFLPHNFADRDPSRECVQGVRLQLEGSKSGGFSGIPLDDVEGESEGEELTNREKEMVKKERKQQHGEGGSVGGPTIHTSRARLLLHAIY